MLAKENRSLRKAQNDCTRSHRLLTKPEVPRAFHKQVNCLRKTRRKKNKKTASQQTSWSSISYSLSDCLSWCSLSFKCWSCIVEVSLEIVTLKSVVFFSLTNCGFLWYVSCLSVMVSVCYTGKLLWCRVKAKLIYGYGIKNFKCC